MAQQVKLFPSADLRPALLRSLAAGYGRGDLVKDLISGLTVGIVALPLAIAFSIGAGGSPAQGLWTAIIAGALIALAGGSRFQVSGPTGAFVVIIADVIARHGMEGLILATLIAGLLLVLLGLSGLGTLIKFIPYPVTVGFTTGIGAIIFVGQVKDLLGLRIAALDADFFGKIGQYAANIGTVDPLAAAVGLGTVATILLIRRLAPRIPAAVTAVAIAAAVVALAGLPVATVASKFGALPAGFPELGLPLMSLQKIREVFPSAITIAMLAAIESLLSAVVADGMTGDRHGANMELVAQGLGNLASALFGGLPATGAIARTATNIKSGARSPISAIVHALVLLLFVLFLGPLAGAIPLAALAGVLVVVAMDMSELPRFFGMRRAPKSDLFVMLVTFLLTVIVDLTAAVQVGVILAVFLFLKRMSETTTIAGTAQIFVPGQDGGAGPEGAADLAAEKLPKDVEVYEINGPFFFGVADMLQDAERGIERPPAAFVLRLRHVPAIDATGLNALSSFAKRCRKSSTVLILEGVREQPREAMAKMGLDLEIGRERLVDSLEEALALARAASAARKAAKEEKHHRGHGNHQTPAPGATP